jgi:hypothetical protein
MLLWVYIHNGRALPNALPTELRGQVGSSKWYFGPESSSFDTNVILLTVAGHIFQARPVWIYTQSNITNIIFTWAHNTNTEKIIKTIVINIVLYS